MSTFEKHFSIPQLVPILGLSKDTLRKIFRNEAGVLRLERAENVRAKRKSYLTMRIPESVVRRVYARMTKVAR